MITLTAEIEPLQRYIFEGSDTTYSVDYSNLISIDQKLIDRKETEMPSWGIISCGGTVSFLDYNGKIRKFASQVSSKTRSRVIVNLNDTLNKTSCQLGEYFSESWDYDNNNNRCTIRITDGLTKLQDININIPYNLHIEPNTKITTALNIYEMLQEKTKENGFSVVSKDELSNSTQNHLRKISISYPYITDTSLWGAWDDFGKAFLVHIFKRRDGK